MSDTSKQTVFMQAYDACHEAFIRYCSALSYGRMDTKDLVQDVLVIAYQNFDKIQDQGKLLHYLVRTARNRSISQWRRSKFRGEWLDKHTENVVARGVSPELSLDIQLLYRMLDKLPSKQRDAVILFEISGFSMREIAVIQDSTEGAVKTKISRGRSKLRQLMAERPTHNSITHILATAKTIAL
ncbi:MAG: RNA polymerase sigma factor [Bacteroidota bacterium]